MRECSKQTNFICLSLVSLLSLGIVLTLSACGSSAPRPAGPVIHPLEQNAINALAAGGDADVEAALDAALTRYRKLDDLEGQWRLHLLKARFYLGAGRMQDAAGQAAALQSIAPAVDARHVRYNTNLILGRVRDDADYFTKALKDAATPLEQAVLHAYLGSTGKAVSLLDASATDHPGDRAFVLYQHARRTQDADLFRRSLTYYRLAADSRGIADSLFSLARITAEDDQPGSARTSAAYAERAIRVLEASGDAARADAIRNWLQSP